MRKLLALLPLALALLAPARCRAEDLDRIYREAVAAWLDGRPEDAAGSLKYAVFRSSDAAMTLPAIKDLCALLAEAGKNAEALPYLDKAAILAPEDPLVRFEKGWNLLAIENHMDARDAFQHALTLTADADLVAQTRFALALAEARLAGPAAAVKQLETVYQRYPYLLAPAAALTSANFLKLKKKSHAVTFLKDSLTYDPRNIQAEIDLARLYEETDYHVPAWQTYYTLAELDPAEPLFEEKAARLRKYVKGKPDNMLYWTRLAFPPHNAPIDYDARGPARIGLYSAGASGPAVLTEFSFIFNTEFSLVDARLGPVTDGKPGAQWNVKYNPVNKVYEIKDNFGSAVHTTRNPFRLVPKNRGGVVLIKNPEPLPKRGVNRGDREAAGELGVLPRENGFLLVNGVGLENCVAPVVSALAGGSRQPEELKALSIVVRTRLLILKNSKPHDSPDYDICDAAHCLVFPGMQAESEPAGKAAAATRDEILTKDGAPAGGLFHTACGGFTEEGVDDGGRRPEPLTPFSLHLALLKAPPENLLCLPHDKTAAADVYWTLLLEPKWIENRANRAAKVGYIKALVPLKRAANGKVLSLRIDGTAGSMTLEGFGEISRVLAGGTLRSALFTVRPLYEGKYPKYFVVRGIGSGDGRGYCLLGARGMVKNGPAKAADILNHYFPYYKVRRAAR